MNLLHCALQFMQNTLGVCLAQFNQINHIANEQTNVVQWIIEFMGYPSCKFSQRCQLASLHKLFLLLAQFLLTSLHLCRRLFQIAHDMNHRFAATFQAQIRLV